jgi:putative FmdB family regulatory protein
MPLYEFACKKCDHTFEELVLSESEKVTCPQCESEKLERLLSVPARPREGTTSLPTACRSEGPPCGPVCSRFGRG